MNAMDERVLTVNEIKPSFAQIIMSVLSAHFRNGFRIGSPIELLRFRHFAAEIFGDEISEADDELMKFIASCGTLFDGKVYVISPQTVARIQRELVASFADGAEAIFFQAFYDKHEEWLFPASVVSVDILKSILLKHYPEYTHRKNYVTNNIDNKTEFDRIESEIIRVWGDDVLRSYSWLAANIPYIPLEKIKYVLAYKEDFIRNSEGIYTHAKKIDITKEELSVIADFVAKRCLTNGYVSLQDIPLGEIEERNFDLTLMAIHNAVFRICLSDKYDKNGKIITRKGDILDTISIIKDYCRTHDKCSFNDLLIFQEELVGQRTNQAPALEAAYAVLVRIDRDTFLAEKYVKFDVTKIDNAIELFVTGDYLPLKSFTTFVAFPYCGQPWNLFLLESYCQRFSNRFRFDTPTLNSRNAGAVIRKSCVLSYVDVMADAVAKAGVLYEEETISRFLYEKGYIGRKITSRAGEIIKKAKTIRKRMG